MSSADGFEVDLDGVGRLGPQWGEVRATVQTAAHGAGTDGPWAPRVRDAVTDFVSAWRHDLDAAALAAGAVQDELLATVTGYARSDERARSALTLGGASR